MRLPPLIVARDGEALAALAADLLARLLRELAAERGWPVVAPASDAARDPGAPSGPCTDEPPRPVTLALAGGHTPRRSYERLAEDRRVPWNALDVYLGDERCVPGDDEASNHNLVHQALCAAGPLDARRLHPMWPPLGPPSHTTAATEPAMRAAAQSYEELLPHPLDVLLLGLGTDGHTASLFPGSPALGETERRVVPARAPIAPHERLTITPPVIAAARHLIVLVSGAHKAEALAAALDGEDDVAAVPGRLARRGSWLVDRAAAAQLRRAR